MQHWKGRFDNGYHVNTTAWLHGAAYECSCLQANIK